MVVAIENMTSNIFAVVFGLASAISWGAGDFSGGMASRKSRASLVVWLSQLVGGGLLLLLALAFGESLPIPRDLFLGAAAGLAGVVGLALLYRGLATGQMGLVAPLTAVISASLPVFVSAVTEGVPPAAKLIGFGFGLLAVWFLSRPETGGQWQLANLWLPFASGTAFALFFVLIDQVTTGAVFWPLVAARVASVTALLAVLWLRGRGKRMMWPNGRLLPLIALSGIFDAGGNAFFVLAAQSGRLDIAAVLSSLYPATTVLLAWLVAHERLRPVQWLGVAAAVVALLLIAL